MDSKELYDFVSGVSDGALLRVEESLGDGFVRLRISEAERRQAQHDIRAVEDIVIEMLRNSRDAHAQTIFVSSAKEGDVRTLTFIDDGEGIPPALQEKIFEPRVTSKLETMVVDQWGVHGRGMALYSVRSNTSVAQVVSSDQGLGASMLVQVDLDQLPERTDQSTWPTVEKDESGKRVVSAGPHNIIRKICEFALENQDIHVYVGTPTEIVATMYALAKRDTTSTEYLFCDDLDTLGVVKRIGGCVDSSEFVACAEGLGIPVSERTAHRVLAGSVPELVPVATKLTGYRPKRQEPTKPDIYKDRRGLKIHADDADEFARKLEDAFEVLGQRYYIGLKTMPKITVTKDRIHVTFEVEKEE